MAATTDATISTSNPEIINSEHIQRTVLEANRPVGVAEQVVWPIRAAGFSTKVHAIPKWDKVDVPLSEASGKAETDEFAATEQTLTEVLVTAVVVGIRKALSMENIDDTVIDLIAGQIRNNANAMREQLNEDVFSNFTSASNASNFSGTNLTQDRFGEAIGKLRALFPMGTRFCAVLAPQQITDLKADLRSSGNALLGGAMGNQLAAGMMDARRLGFIDMYEGVEMYESGVVPDFDSDNHSGGLFVGGVEGALALAVWNPITHLVEGELKRLQTDLITFARYGTAITNQAHLVEVISAKV